MTDTRTGTGRRMEDQHCGNHEANTAAINTTKGRFTAMLWFLGILILGTGVIYQKVSVIADLLSLNQTAIAVQSVQIATLATRIEKIERECDRNREAEQRRDVK